jgi:hypothetical protein
LIGGKRELGVIIGGGEPHKTLLEYGNIINEKILLNKKKFWNGSQPLWIKNR